MLVFCTQCEALLDPPTADTVECHCCALSVSSQVFEKGQSVTHSRPEVFNNKPQRLTSNTSIKTDGATIKEKCPQCDGCLFN
jgi:DNA-directed RNA polymerase subunit M/transcription elongation factor TFIIS